MTKPIVIGVTGGSGSGKTLFIKRLVKEVKNVALLSMDNYYIERNAQPKDKMGVENFDTLESIDQAKFAGDLKKLISGDTLEIKEYTYNNDQVKPKILKIESKPVILVEGIFTLHFKEIRDLLNLKIYIEAPGYLMLKRRIIRDANERGYDLSDVLYRFEHHVTPSFQQYIDPSKKWADLIIPNHKNFDVALKVISTFLNQ
ncbi:uridine kinase [Ekhidna lutea]|uniref:uridine/cytidine kinase n=1 Tax=Ekhidna lutea TaxID=447679 RepID=A0A239IM12_EKHLU|nr:uridine-cytidine kinase [Ekhidna lutea]SNS94432.1 uridine kinase [Ekhidna lutea]